MLKKMTSSTGYLRKSVVIGFLRVPSAKVAILISCRKSISRVFQDLKCTESDTSINIVHEHDNIYRYKIPMNIPPMIVIPEYSRSLIPIRSTSGFWIVQVALASVEPPRSCFPRAWAAATLRPLEHQIRAHLDKNHSIGPSKPQSFGEMLVHFGSFWFMFHLFSLSKMKRLAHDSRPGDDAAMFTTLTDPGVMALKQAVQGWGWLKTVKTMLGTMFGTMFAEQTRIQQLIGIQQLMIPQLIWSDSETNRIQKLMCSDSQTNDSETNVFGFRNKLFRIQKLMKLDSETNYSETSDSSMRNK